MTVLADFIVYLWLLPVTLQILIPLAMLLVYTVSKLLTSISKQEKVMSEKIANLSTPAAKESV